MRTARRPLIPLFLLVACTACARGVLPPVVEAPSAPAFAMPPVARAASAVRSAQPETPDACAKPWKLDVLDGDARVVVVCGNDVRRQTFDQSSSIARALFPALDPTRERVCACAARVRAPAFVDLVFTSRPEEGRVTVRAAGDDDLDPDLGPAFVACIGTVAAAFAPLPSEACPGAGKASLVYPVRLDLGRGSPDEAP